jgi:ADP-ribosylation factor 6
MFLYFKALKPDQLQERLGLSTLKDRVWYIQPCSAIKGDGLYEGLVWLSTSCKS